METHSTDSMIWTFLPGLHGTDELFGGVRRRIPEGVETEFINLPTTGKQDYKTLTAWLDQELKHCPKRLIIAESFSGPLALHFAAQRPDEISGIVLVSTFCDTPLNPGFTLLPLRPLFMVKPPRTALCHFLIGDDASEVEIQELAAVVQSIPSAAITKRVRAVLELIERDIPPLPKLPMLILQAQSDNLIPWDTQRKLEACYPDAQVHWIESPHLMLQRYPEICVDHICKFAEEL